MNNNNGNKLYMHRIIKLISPITCQTFKVELNGEEEEMKELLGTILEINPKSIKGLRDSFNNYYTISSAVKNPLLNTDPYNYYTVVIKQSNDIKYMKYPSLNLSNHDQISNGRNNYEKNFENKTMNYLDNDDNNFYQQNNDNDKFGMKDLLKLVKELYKRNYIDRNLKKKLKKLVKENNPEIIYILKTFLNSKKNYYELAKKIKPVLSSSSSNSDNNEDSKYNSSSNNSSRSSSKKKHKQKSHHKDKDINNKNNKKENVTKEEKILNDIKLNFEKGQYSKLKELLKKKNPEIIKSIKKFEKDNDYNHLISKLNSISKSYQENSGKEISSDASNESSEGSDEDSGLKKNDSSDFAKQGNKKQKKNNHKEADIKNITKKIYSAMKKMRKDLYYFARYDLDKMKTEEKISLFKKKFKLNLDKINSENNYKIPKKNISKIEKYYTQYMLKKVFNNFNEDEKSIYEILCENEEKGEVDQIYKDLLKNRDLKEFENQIKKLIEKEDKVDVEEGEDEYIKEENEDEEDEDFEGEEDEENEGDENDDDPDKKEDSSSNNFILNNGDKDATTRMLNNNYKKNLNNNINKSASKNKSKEISADKSEKEEKKNNEEGNNNMGLDFVLIKPKKMNNKEEERKGQESIDENDKNNNLNLFQNKDKENSISTSTHKKMNVFISQIEHIKKIDEIKKPIIEAIYQNNKYIMELYEKFQKNKSILNKKSLYDVFKKIQENPEIKENTKSNKDDKQSTEFQSLIQNNDKLDETQKEFICYDFNNNKESKFIGVYNEYKQLNDINEFYETIDLYLTKNKNNNELYLKFCLKKIKDSGNSNILENSKKFINNIKKNGFYSEQDCKIMENYLGKDDGVFLGIFRELFKTDNFNEFVENMNLALATKKKEGNDKSKWDNDIIIKNYEELKKNIDEKDWNALEQFYRKKSEKLYEILQNLNNKNLKSKIESTRVLILKKELSQT